MGQLSEISDWWLGVAKLLLDQAILWNALYVEVEEGETANIKFCKFFLPNWIVASHLKLKIRFCKEIQEKLDLRYEHGSVTSCPYRKIWRTNRSTYGRTGGIKVKLHFQCRHSFNVIYTFIFITKFLGERVCAYLFSEMFHGIFALKGGGGAVCKVNFTKFWS